MKLSNIDLSKIKLPQVVKVINNQMAQGAVYFTDLKTTAPTSENIDSYRKVTDRFVIPFPIEKVFAHYLTMNPSNVWKQGGLLGYECCLDKNTGEVYYNGDPYPGVKVGHILYMQSNLWGMHTLCMAQEIIRVDLENYNITFSYTDWGMTKGTQSMQFNKISDSQTVLIHLAHYKGVSSFRDIFYPFFHSMIMRKLHQSVLETLK